MLNILLGADDETIQDVDVWFDNEYDDDWLEDEFVKQMVLDIDDSKIISPRCIESPVLGQIPPTDLSSGVKALILMYKIDKTIYATVCGDNCAKWIVEIAKHKDITICLEHYMMFPEHVTAHILNFNSDIHSNAQLQREMLHFSCGIE